MRLGFENGLKPDYKPPEEFVYAVGARMSLERGVIESGLQIAQDYHQRGFSSSSPRTIAASALYLACSENGSRRTQHEIAIKFGIAEYTVREVSAKIGKFLRCYNG